MATYRHTDGTVYRTGDVVGGVRTGPNTSPQAWADLGCVPYAPEPLPPATAEDDTARCAAALAAACPELPERVRAALAALQDAMALGVSLDLANGIPGWDEIGAAFAAAIETADDPRPLMAVQTRAQGNWFHYATKAGSFADAYRLAAAVAQL